MNQNRPQTQPTQTFPTYNQNSQINSAYGSGAPQISTEELQVCFNNVIFQQFTEFKKSAYIYREDKRNWSEKPKS